MVSASVRFFTALGGLTLFFSAPGFAQGQSEAGRAQNQVPTPAPSQMPGSSESSGQELPPGEGTQENKDKKSETIEAVPFPGIFAVIPEQETGRLDLGAEFDLEDKFSGGAAGTLDVSLPHFDLGMAMRFVNDGKRLPTEPWMDQLYFDLQQSWVKFNVEGISLKGGFRTAAPTASQNPYNVLLNPNGLASIGLDLAYDGEFFHYESRWIGLNYLSLHSYGYSTDADGDATTWLDRGLNTKMFLLKFGALRFGYQEASIFLNRYFDANFFLNPIPTIILNTLWSNQSANPWAMDTNASSMMGFYADYEWERWRFEAEIVFKDFNMNDFGLSTAQDNNNKFGWSAGAQWDSPVGKFEFWHGGTTKYMYEASLQDGSYDNRYPYQYTYYPVSQIDGREIDLEENYIGNPNGEGSLAFKIAWSDTLIREKDFELGVKTAFEYVARGSQSPENPWQNNTAPTKPSTQIFTGEDVLEHKLLFNTKISFSFFRFFAVLSLDLGAKLNALQLRAASDGGPAFWQPTEGNTVNISSARLWLGYSFRF